MKKTGKKGRWSEVEIKPEVLADPEFESLASFTELTDYTIVDGKLQVGKAKRKSKSNEDVEEESDEPKPKRVKSAEGDKKVKSAKKTKAATKAKKQTKEETNAVNQVKESKKSTSAEAEAKFKNLKKRKKNKRKKKLKLKKLAEKAAQAEGSVEKEDQPPDAVAQMDTEAENTEQADSGKQEGAEDEDDISKNWAGLFVPNSIIRALRHGNFAHPTEVQRLSLPAAISARRDMLIAAETGSGKTLAYGIPVVSQVLRTLEKFEDPRSCGLLACVITPTRELAVQVKRHLEAAAAFSPVRVALVVGGLDEHKQRRVLNAGPQVVVATPGRFWALMEDGENELLEAARSTLRCLVVDEADRLIEEGHFDELDRILAHFNSDEKARAERQNFVCSATLTFDPTSRKARCSKLAELCDRIGLRKNFKTVNLTPAGITATRVTECVAKCVADDKDLFAISLLFAHVGRTLVFVNSKSSLRRLVTLLQLVFAHRPRRILRLAANMEQKARLRSVESFTSLSDAILVATDVAARGLDVPNVDYVIHYHVPASAETYVHRCGRTARCASDGVSVLLVAPMELQRYENIITALERPEGLPKLEMSGAEVDRWRGAVRLAETITSRQIADSRKRNDARWLTSLADAADCELDEAMRDELGLSDDSDSEGALSSRQKKKRRGKLRVSAKEQTSLVQMKQQLAQMLDSAQRLAKRNRLPR